MITYKGRQIPQTYQEIVHPKHTAFIVHEMLNDFMAKGGLYDQQGRRVDTSAVLPRMVRILAKARQHNVRVIYVRYSRFPDYRAYSDPQIAGEYAKIIDPNFKQHALYGTWGWENIDELKPQEGDFIVSKFRVDSFINTNLDLLLRSNGIRTIVIAGYGAEYGILPTVNHASNLGYFVAAPEDCLLAANPDNQDAANKMIGIYGKMEKSDVLISAWDAAKR